MFQTKSLQKDLVFYTVPEIAEILKLGEKTVYNYVRDGEIPARKVGRKWLVSQMDLEHFINSSTTNI